MKHLILTAAIASMSLNSGCNDSKKISGVRASGSEALYLSEWKLTELQGQSVTSGSGAYLAFSAGQPNRVSGNTGCNRLNGTFELSGTNNIQFSPLAVTKMACLDNGVGDTESKFLDALSKATGWRIADGQLSLLNGTAVLATLNGQKPPANEELKLNGAWELNYISGPKIAFEGLFPHKKPLIVFDLPKPEVNGNGGCNGYSCKVKVDGNKISFGDALSTMMACEGNGEPLYFKTLKTVTGFTISNNTLNMLMDDLVVLRFVKK